jgi:hypothetical protein
MLTRSPVQVGLFRMTLHALHRSAERGISLQVIQIVLHYGQPTWRKGGALYAIGRDAPRPFSVPGGLWRDAMRVIVVVRSGLIPTVFRARRRKSSPGRRSGLAGAVGPSGL